MDASKISFFSATKEALSNPGLDWDKKRALKIERVKTYIRSKPVGFKFKFADLISAAGYNPADRNAYAAGYAFVKALDGKELTIEKTPKFRKSVTILKDDSVRVLTPKREEQLTKGEGNKAAEDQAPNVVGAHDIALVRYVERLARDFSWRNDSNDLREFVRSLK